MKKISVIGHYAYGLEYLDGQTIKTKIITKQLCEEFGDSAVLQFDTHGGIKTLLKAPIYVWKALKQSQNVIILPAHNGLQVFGRLLPWFKSIFKHRKIHYVVIGGWLPKMLNSKKGLAKSLKKFDGIYVETSTMKKALEAQGFVNIYVVPNCKELTPLFPNDLIYSREAPYKLCTFSRVMKEKGIEDAINAVKEVNSSCDKTLFTLDIYGQIDSAQVEWFEKLKEDFPSYIEYKGLVPYDKSVEVLKNYFALLFPTRFFTEGIPGTIIDAYAAGVPVISAKWESFTDIINDNQTGIGYKFNNVEDLKKKLWDITNGTLDINALKLNCLNKSKEYTSKEAIKTLLSQLL